MAQLKNDSKEVRIGLEEIVCHFQELEDRREPINIHHPLESVIVIAIMGLLAGASGPTSIADWAKVKESLLCGLMPLPYGVPRKDVFHACGRHLNRKHFRTVLPVGLMHSMLASKRQLARLVRLWE